MPPEAQVHGWLCASIWASPHAQHHQFCVPVSVMNVTTRWGAICSVYFYVLPTSTSGKWTPLSAPIWLPLNPQKKYTQFFLFQFVLEHNCWTLLSLTWVPLPISHLGLSTCSKLQLLSSPDHPPVGAAFVATPF